MVIVYGPLYSIMITSLLPESLVLLFSCCVTLKQVTSENLGFLLNVEGNINFHQQGFSAKQKIMYVSHFACRSECSNYVMHLSH